MRLIKWFFEFLLGIKETENSEEITVLEVYPGVWGFERDGVRFGMYATEQDAFKVARFNHLKPIRKQ